MKARIVTNSPCDLPTEIITVMASRLSYGDFVPGLTIHKLTWSGCIVFSPRRSGER